MGHLDDVTVDELRHALDEVEGARPAQRLLAAIAYENGVSQTELAEWHGVSRRTIYNWLDRVDADAVTESVTDERRPGRPRALDAAERARLEATLRDSPTAAGFEAAAWTPALVQRWVRAEHGASYSIPSCRRLLREAGLEYRTSVSAAGGRSDGFGSADDAEPGPDGVWVPSGSAQP